MAIPDPAKTFPIKDIDRLVFLKNVVTNPRIEIGDYTYYDDPCGPELFEDNVLYHFDFIGDRLMIGKFCQIAAKATFIMNGANHGMGGVSTYPFAAFGGDWAGRFAEEISGENKGDTVIGNDVWIGYGAHFMPGVQIGDGAIIASGSVVTDHVPPYTIVGGNPARPIRQRFSDDDIQFLLQVRWWDWDIEKVTRLVPALGQGGVEAFRRALAAD